MPFLGALLNKTGPDSRSGLIGKRFPETSPRSTPFEIPEVQNGLPRTFGNNNSTANNMNFEGIPRQWAMRSKNYRRFPFNPLGDFYSQPGLMSNLFNRNRF